MTPTLAADYGAWLREHLHGEADTETRAILSLAFAGGWHAALAAVEAKGWQAGAATDEYLMASAYRILRAVREVREGVPGQ